MINTKNHKEYSAIDAIVSQDEISNMIEQYALKKIYLLGKLKI